MRDPASRLQSYCTIPAPNRSFWRASQPENFETLDSLKIGSVGMTDSESQSQQSWAAWFLDAYANSVVASHEDFHEDVNDDSAYDSMSPTPSEVGSSDSSSPYGPYIRTGRGGAGNFQWQSTKSSFDMEAQKPACLKEKRRVTVQIEHLDTSAAVRNAQTRKTSQYARIGRGGAGNIPFIQSNEPQASPVTPSFTMSPTSTSSPIIRAGRGGAGNFNVAKSKSDAARIEKEKLDEAEAEKRREQAEQKVQNMLQAPTQAYSGQRRRSMLPEDLENPNWT